MTRAETGIPRTDDDATPSAQAHPPLALSLLRLARPKQWAKSAFVLIGPIYGFADKLELNPALTPAGIIVPALIATIAFSLASSGCYVINDILDREADRLHPRKRRRPIAAGHVSLNVARIYALALFLVTAGILMLLPGDVRKWVGLTVFLYVANVFAYSFYFKKKVIGDVISLSLGFVLRVMGGCAAIAIVPSTWLLNVTFFLSMFLAFGKRLGERRTLAVEGGQGLADPTRIVAHRKVQERYTDVLLQMAVVVTAVATLMTYAAYVQDADRTHPDNPFGFNILWLTLLPATYGLLRCIVLLEAGKFDDPTELAFRDRGFIVASLVFAAITAGVLVARHLGAAA